MKICLCPASIAWITRNLKKSALKKWRLMKSRNSTTTRRKTKGKSRTKSRKSSKSKGGRRAQQARFRAAAKKCKGKGKGFRPCMKRELKKRR